MSTDEKEFLIRFWAEEEQKAERRVERAAFWVVAWARGTLEAPTHKRAVAAQPRRQEATGRLWRALNDLKKLRVRQERDRVERGYQV